MIYFDNAATSRPKPEVVYQAYEYYVREIGTSPGRGSYRLAIEASRMLYQTRKTVAQFFGISEPSNVIFTKNSTEALNLFFHGFLKQGDHVIISPFEHNAVLRPLHALKVKGIIDYSILPERMLYDDKEDLKKYVTSSTKAIVLTLASNLTGQIVFNTRIAQQAHRYGLFVVVDASQGGGKQLLDMQRDGVDVLAFTGHKDLLAMPGVGGLISAQPLHIQPLLQGGTGIHGESYVNPDAYPDSYEAGTLNMPAIWSLKCAMDYIQGYHEEMAEKEALLLESLLGRMTADKRFIVYRPDHKRVPTFCFNVRGVSSSDVVRFLDGHDICVRGGIHCAILAHETLDTVMTGAVRVSLNAFNTMDEVDTFIRVLGEI